MSACCISWHRTLLYVHGHDHLRHGLCSLLDRIQPRVVSYEEQVTTVREHLASLLEKEEDWSKAAQTLAGIDLDSGTLLTSLVLPQYANPFAIWGLAHSCGGKYYVLKDWDPILAPTACLSSSS